jgi:leader peptidase (prepilin peptidase) / N-methyltransferase
VGIALNRLIYQLPRDLNLLGQPVCSACGTPIPLVVFGDRGQCRQCDEPLGYDRVEGLVAALFLFVALGLGFGPKLLVYSLDLVVLTIITFIDLRHRYVYTLISLPATVAALILTPTAAGLGFPSTIAGFGVGALIFFLFYWLGRMLYRGAEPMGTGDITIAALVGAMVGFPHIVTALFIGIFASALIGVAAMMAQRTGRRGFIPYGPGLCIGALIALSSEIVAGG